jgi:hypothetical protein
MLIQDPDNFLGILGSDRYVDKDGELINRKFDGSKGDYIIYGKAQRFMEFIRHCNQMQSQGFINTSEAVPHWRFVGENDDEADVYWNAFTKRWEVRIVICEPNGDIEDYGFNPTEPDLPIDPNLINAILNKPQKQQQTPTEEIIPIEEPKTGLSKAEIKLREKELEQEDERLKLEQAKSKRKDKLLEKYLDGKIDDNTFLEMLKII